MHLVQFIQNIKTMHGPDTKRAQLYMRLLFTSPIYINIRENRRGNQ